MSYSNAYIIGFAASVCVVCSIFVSGSAVSLKKTQENNQVLDLNKNIIKVSGLIEGDDAEKSKKIAGMAASDIDKYFDKETGQITMKYIDLMSGEPAKQFEGLEAKEVDKKLKVECESFAVDMKASETIDAGKCIDLKGAINKAGGNELCELPNKAKLKCRPTVRKVFEVRKEGKLSRIILPVEGKGLWSTMYGFLALNDKGEKVEDITFYKDGETPGLGAEINNRNWQLGWIGLTAYDAEGNPGIKVMKGKAQNQAGKPKYQVDGLSGATLTANGVTELTKFWLGKQGYQTYIDKTTGGE